MKKTLPSLPKPITLFWLVLANFGFILLMFLVPSVGNLFSGWVFLLPFFIFSLLGFLLVLSTLKRKTSLKKHFLLTGAGAVGFFVGTVLHNVFYALAILTQNILFLSRFLSILDVILFLVAVFVCPIVFLVGVGGGFVKIVGKSKWTKKLQKKS